MERTPGRRPVVSARTLAGSAAIAATLLTCAPAFAQEDGPTPAPAPSRSIASVEEIIVTARKREETLQDVPLSVAAYSSDQLIARGLNSDYDISNFTVGFRTLPQTGRDTDRPTIRGMAAPPSRGEPNASYFIDGMFVSGSIATATTSSVERVEVLRGPQSAQFGRATFAGAVNYVTRNPGDVLEGQFNGRAGTHDDYSVGGWLSGPIVDDTLYFVASANWTKYGGQWHNNLAPGEASYELETRPDVRPFREFLLDPPQSGDHSRLGAEETIDVLTKVVWRPVDGSEVSLRYMYTDGEDTHFPSFEANELNCFVPTEDNTDEVWWGTSQGDYCGKWSAEGRQNRINLPDFREGVTYILANNFPNPEDYSIPGQEPGTYRTQNRVMLEWAQDIGEYTLTSRGGWSRDKFQQMFDLDHTATRALWGLFHFDNRRDIEDWSAEVRLDSPADLPIRGGIGLYWYEQDRENFQRSYLGPAVVLGGAPADFPPSVFVDVSNKAVFGILEFDLADQWTLALEARYAEDSKSQKGGALLQPDVPGEVSLEFKNFTPRMTLRFEPSDDLTLYFLTAKGNKPGDFNSEFFRSGIAASAVNAAITGCVIPPAGQTPILPCDLEEGELTGEPLGIIKEEEQWTYELGMKANWLDGRLSTNLAGYYIDWTNQGLFSIVQILQNTGTYLTTTIVRNVGKSEVKGFEFESTFRVTDNLSLVANYGYTDSKYVEGEDPAHGETTGDASISGNTVIGVPKHTVILSAYATAPLTDELSLFLSPDFVFNSKRYTSAGNLAWLGNEKTLNFRMGVEASNWTVTAYVRNVLDDITPLAALDFVNFGTIDPNYPVNEFGNLVNDLDPRSHSLSPKRGRDWGLEFQYRF